MKIEDGKIFANVVPGTYAKIDPGKDELLDIDMQFTVYDDNNDIVGNIIGTVAQFRIYNVSDDKPKFILKKEQQFTSSEFVPPNKTVVVA